MAKINREADPAKGTRAAVVQVNGGDVFYDDCKRCNDRIKFMAKNSAKAALHLAEVVVANVYDGETWDHVEYFHPDCYYLSGQPAGELFEEPPVAATVKAALGIIAYKTAQPANQ